MNFPANSRYASIDTTTLVAADGTTIAYMRRRFVPAPETMTVQRQHSVVEGDRLDNLAAVYIGDPELSWRIADANRAMRSEALTERVGRVLDISLPPGMTGGALV